MTQWVSEGHEPCDAALSLVPGARELHPPVNLRHHRIGPELCGADGCIGPYPMSTGRGSGAGGPAQLLENGSQRLIWGVVPPLINCFASRSLVCDAEGVLTAPELLLGCGTAPGSVEEPRERGELLRQVRLERGEGLALHAREVLQLLHDELLRVLHLCVVFRRSQCISRGFSDLAANGGWERKHRRISDHSNLPVTAMPTNLRRLRT